MTQKLRGSYRVILALATGLALISTAPVLASPGSGGKSDMNGGAHGCKFHGPKMSRLVVSGEGEARIAPELAQIQLGVTSQADSAADAMQQNSELQTKVIEALKEAGITSENIQTSGLNLNPRMEYPENGAPTINGYEASNMVSIRVTEISELGEVLDSIVAAGANQIQGISFERREKGETGDEALKAAVEDAARKAEVMAEAAGMKLGPVMMIRDAPVAGGPEPVRMYAQEARAASAPIEAGELALSAQVQVEYALIGDKAPDCEQGQGDAPEGEAAEPETPEEPQDAN